MEDLKLNYSKDWRNPADFPTVEPDEAKVREDMQILYTEIQEFLNNKIIPAMKLLEIPGIENLPVEDAVSNSKSRIPTSYAVAKLFAANGNIPAGGAAGQFLVKTDDAYGAAEWATFAIPSRVSDLVAIDENYNPVNAQALLSEVTEKAGYRTPDLIAEGEIKYGTTVNLGDISEYETYWLIFENPGVEVINPGTVYLGAWDGYSEAGMLMLSSLVFGDDPLSTVCAELTIHRTEDRAIIRYMQNTTHGSGGTPFDGLMIREVSSSVVPEPGVITLFPSSVSPAADDDEEKRIAYKVYGIRRGRPIGGEVNDGT